ncbi:MAG: hypothetical protein WAO98_05790 [Alphaproteobacteria bacterium]
MKALLLTGDTTYLPLVLPVLKEHLADVDVYALGINIYAKKYGALPGLFKSAYTVEHVDPELVVERMSHIPNLAHASVVSVEITDQHIPWMHQFDLAKELYRMIPKKYSHYIRSRFDNVMCEPCSYTEDIIVPTRYHHDLDLLNKVYSDQFAVVPAHYSDVFFKFSDYYNQFKNEITRELIAKNYNTRMDLIPEYKLKEYLDQKAIPVNSKTIKVYPYSWLHRLRNDANNAYIKDLPSGFL